MEWASLHHHTSLGSYFDAAGLPADHVNRCVELGIPALALTEHGGVSSHVQLERAAVDAGVQPIFGCELYCEMGLVDGKRSRYKNHLTVLAMNDVGYRNLLALVSRGYDQFHYVPTITGRDLAEFSDGLIVLSGCSGSRIVCELLGGKGLADPGSCGAGAARRVAARFKALLGDRYYFEVQAFPSLERTRHTNVALAEIGAGLGVELVGTLDCHYTRPDESDLQVVLHSIGRGGGKASFDEQASSWSYSVKLTPPVFETGSSVGEVVIRELIATGLTKRQAEQATTNTGAIASRCNVTLPKMSRLVYPVSKEDLEPWTENGDAPRARITG